VVILVKIIGVSCKDLCLELVLVLTRSCFDFAQGIYYLLNYMRSKTTQHLTRSTVDIKNVRMEIVRFKN
jgi:hypothetical protein